MVNFFKSFRKQFIINFSKVFVESVKQHLIVEDVNYPTCFSDTMHTHHWSPDINSFNSCFRSYQRPNSWSTQSIIPDNEVLHRNTYFFCTGSKDWSTHWISHVSLIGISFYDNSLVDFRGMSRLVLFRVIRVNGVGHICWD